MAGSARPDRRQFVRAAAGLVTAGLTAARAAPPAAARPVTVGLIADLHHGLAPNAQARLDTFMAAVEDRRPDFLLQLGDFCHPPRAVPAAAACLRAFASFRGSTYHVLGNHDLDLARDKREIMDAWGMERAYYSFDRGDFHFAVLNCNCVLKADGSVADWAAGNRYEGRVHPEQIDWLRADLARTSRPTVIISHQGFGPKDKGGVVPNGDSVRRVISDANRAGRAGKVILCLHGHNHRDGACVIDGVHYVQLNSASYLWVGEEYGRMAAYTDPLYAFLTLDPSGTIRIEGRPGRFQQPTPAERGYPDAAKVTAAIADRDLRFTGPAARSVPH